MKKRVLSVFIAVMMIISITIILPTAASTEQTYPTPAGYNDNDYQKLVKFALQDDNLTKLGWNLSDPASWSRITWNNDTERRVQRISFFNLDLIGKLDVSDFTALEWLSCFDNYISVLDVSGCTALTTLSCGNNQITELDVSGLTSLESLWCYDNQISVLDVSRLTALESLWCHDNQISVLDVSGLTALTSLQCGNNQISELDVSKLTALTWLSCYDNQISVLDVSGLTALTWLSCGDNQISELDVSKLTALESLWCHDNQISVLDVSGLTALTWLGCGDNQISELNVSGLTSLEWLDCENNQISDIFSSLEDLNKLYYVNVSFNNLDLDNPAIQASIEKIQAIININATESWHGFTFEPQGTPPTLCPFCDEIPCICETTDNADITAAKTLVENAFPETVTQIEVADEAAALVKVNEIISGLDLNGVIPVVNKIDYTAPQAGTENNPTGTNGSYTFTVKLNKGAGTEQTTTTLTLTITATEYADGVDPVDPIDGFFNIFKIISSILDVSAKISDDAVVIVNGEPVSITSGNAGNLTVKIEFITPTTDVNEFFNAITDAIS